MFNYCLMDCTHSWPLAEGHQLIEEMDLLHYILNIIGGIITNVKRTEERKKPLRRCCQSCAQGPGRLHQVKLPAEFSLKKAKQVEELLSFSLTS